MDGLKRFWLKPAECQPLSAVRELSSSTASVFHGKTMELSPQVLSNKLEELCIYLWNLKNLSQSGILQEKRSNHDAIWITSVILAIVTCVIGILGNAVVIWLTAVKMKKVKSNMWFLNLAVADFGFLLCLPPWLVSLFLEHWPFGTFLCKTHHFAFTVNMYASIFILTGLSIDRCLSIVLPLWHRKHVSRRFYLCVCLALWTVTVLLSVPIMLHSKVTRGSGGKQCELVFYGEEVFNVGNLVLNSSECGPEPKTATQSEHLVISTLSSSHADHSTSGYPPFTAAAIINYSRVDEMSHDNIGNGSPFSGYGVMEDWGQVVQSVVQSLVKRDAQLSFPRLPLNQQDCQNEVWQASLRNCTKADEVDKWQRMLSSMGAILMPLLVVGIFIPLAVIIASNVLVILQVSKSQSGKKGNFTRLYAVILSMVASYFLSWMPLTVVQMMIMDATHQMDLRRLYSLISVMPLLSSIASFNSCLNPILYVLIGQKVKAELKKSMVGIWQSATDNSQSMLHHDQSK
ncbi:N-formyl peptide receptor 3-like isoform X2 [Ambystoma mexicanum]|uniref:N-formyl peptide receptor 3-like isoform X2 n=1 Tax=Ambystoma mexicanum TaxID=8296 RepID=UPI0037E7F4D7